MILRQDYNINADAHGHAVYASETGVSSYTASYILDELDQSSCRRPCVILCIPYCIASYIPLVMCLPFTLESRNNNHVLHI